MVREGIRNGSVRFVRDPNMDHGTVCQIGDNWFYFGHLKAEELDPDEYVKATPEADAMCDLLFQLYAAQGEEVVFHTGYYDPAEDARSGEEDRCTGWWYVDCD